jgi:glycosyltransferase involved in cell wall biosynthesis
MRIAIFHDLPSGGAKRALYEYCKRLVDNHEIDVFTLSIANHDFADLRPLATAHHVYEFQPGKLFDSPFGRLNQAVRVADLQRMGRLMREVAQDIDRGGYDVLLAHPGQFEKAPSVLAYCTTPGVYYCPEILRQLYETQPPRPYDDSASSRRQFLNRIDPLLAWYTASAKRVDRQNTRQADMVLVNSAFTREAVRQVYGVAADVAYPAVDVDWFRPLGLAKRPFLLSVGSLTPMKGFDFLIEALAHLPEENRLPLVIASNFQNPPERDFLQELAHQRGVTLHLEGNVTDEKLRQLYNEAMLTLFSPVREPLGLVPLESMACGTAVVTVREGGMQETMLDGQTGRVVARDPAQFAQAIQHLLANPELAQEYGRFGRQYVVENWTWEQATATLASYLQMAVAKPLPATTIPSPA